MKVWSLPNFAKRTRGRAVARSVLPSLAAQPELGSSCTRAMPRAGSSLAMTDAAVAIAARAQQAARARRSQVLALCNEESGGVGASSTSRTLKRAMSTGDDKHVDRASRAPRHLGLLESLTLTRQQCSVVDHSAADRATWRQRSGVRASRAAPKGCDTVASVLARMQSAARASRSRVLGSRGEELPTRESPAALSGARVRATLAIDRQAWRSSVQPWRVRLRLGVCGRAGVVLKRKRVPKPHANERFRDGLPMLGPWPRPPELLAWPAQKVDESHSNPHRNPRPDLGPCS